MRRLIIGLVAAIVCSGVDAALAQRGPVAAAWFGLRLPPGLGDPHQPVVNVDGVTAPAVSIPAGEGPDEALAGATIRRDLERIVGFSRESRAAGNRVWGRITGFPSAAATASWVAEQFKAAGLSNVAIQKYDGTGAMWWSNNWEARLLPAANFGAGSAPVVLESAIPTSGSQIPRRRPFWS